MRVLLLLSLTGLVVGQPVNPSVPTLKESGIGEDHFNITFIPSPFDEASRQPVGSNHLVRYRESGTETWHEAKPDNDDLTVKVADLAPGTKYDVSVVAVHTDDVGQQKETMSAIHQITTAGSTPRSARLYLLLLILLIILLLLIICCIICVALRHRGENYPVSQKERDQGREREPVLGSAKGSHFGEYAGPDDEKRSLTGSKTESETDSMAEYGDGNLGRFDEDGSFIRVYVPQNPIVQERPEKGSTSTFV